LRGKVRLRFFSLRDGREKDKIRGLKEGRTTKTLIKERNNRFLNVGGGSEGKSISFSKEESKRKREKKSRLTSANGTLER